MTKKTKIGIVGIAFIALVMVASEGCNRRSSENKQMMQGLAGKWTSSQKGNQYTTVIVLDLTKKGRYTQTTYAEIQGKRKLLYINRFKADFRFEPDNPQEKANLEKEGFEPAVESGRCFLDAKKGTRTITFEADVKSGALAADGVGKRESVLTIVGGNQQIQIGGKTYIREPDTASGQ